MDFRTVHGGDAASLAGAPNVDSRCTATSFFGGPEDPNSLIAKLNVANEKQARNASASSNLAYSQLARAGRDASMRRVPDRYAAKMQLEAAAAIDAAEREKMANIERANLLAVAGMQGQLAGKRGDLLDAYMNAQRMPLSVRQQATAADIAAGSQLGNLDLSNLYAYSPADEIAKQLQLYGGVRDLRKDMRYEGLQKMFQDPEAQLVAGLEHPHIDPIYDYWRDPDAAYMVMRYMRGGALTNLINGRQWPLPEVNRNLSQITGALALAHRYGVVHRDIKPVNILLDEEHNAYLAEFGIAQILSNSQK